MITVIQRVKRARIINLKETEIQRGLVVLIAFENSDIEEKFQKFINKILNLRVFEDENEKINFSVKDINGEILLVPNFTLAGYLKGNRPSFDNAMPIEKARAFFEKLKQEFLESYSRVKFGKFQSYMELEIVNDGSFTLIYSL
jgi:D-aminoacyl-tRNA deacylase